LLEGSSYGIPMVSRLARLAGSMLKWALPVPALLFSSGCGDFFSHKPTELETRLILSELKDIKENPFVENPLPELYRQPPERLETEDGVKLFYFSKQHTVDKLAQLVEVQFSQFFRSQSSAREPKGKEYPKPTYSVSTNAATNQLIVHCPNEADVDKVLGFLEKVDVPPIQVNIDCLVLERFADVTMDWETTIKIENLFGEKITLGGKQDESGNLLPAFPGASLREPARSTFGLDLGYWRNQGIAGHEFRAVVDMLISRGYLKILMNPSIETVNGQRGKVSLRDNVPLEKIIFEPGQERPFSSTEYQWVEDTLEVTPHVYADGSIGLQTKIQLGSKSKPEGVIQREIITERSIEIAENRIKPGDSLVIGGIRKNEERAVVRGVPFLKDIPLIGILFSSKDFEDKATEVIFILTPSISSGGVDYAEMLEDVRRKQARPQLGIDLQSTLTDPFGSAAYTEQVEQKAARAEFERFKARIEKAEALQQMDRIQQRLLEAAEQVLAEKTRAERARAEAVEAKQQAQSARREAIRAQREVERIKAEIEKSQSKADKTEPPAKGSAEDPDPEKGKRTAETRESETHVEKAEAETDPAATEAGRA